jgi:hypothetical protein
LFPKKGFFLKLQCKNGRRRHVVPFFVLTPASWLSQTIPTGLGFDFDFFLTWAMRFRHPEQFAGIWVDVFLFLLFQPGRLFLLPVISRKHEKG